MVVTKIVRGVPISPSFDPILPLRLSRLGVPWLSFIEDALAGLNQGTNPAP